MPDALAEGLRINYDDLGQGEPVLLFLPGWCANRTVFQDLLPHSSKRQRCLSLDWRGHGQSEYPTQDFGEAGLVADALSVIEASGARYVVPVALAHSGWVAIELRRRLRERIPKLIFIEWLILGAPPPFLDALKGLRSKDHWQQTRDQIFSQWLSGIGNLKLVHFVREEMGGYGYDMWARSGREIGEAYAKAGSPLRLLSMLTPPVPSLHIYAQPDSPAFWEEQRKFADAQPWFHVQKLDARSHFPMFEVPKDLSEAIENFL